MTREQEELVDRKLYTRQPRGEPPVRSSEIVGLLARGLEAAEGAQVVMEAWCAEGYDPFNNDNYCRLMNWMRDARRALGKQPNAPHELPARTTKDHE